MINIITNIKATIGHRALTLLIAILFTSGGCRKNHHMSMMVPKDKNGKPLTDEAALQLAIERSLSVSDQSNIDSAPNTGDTKKKVEEECKSNDEELQMAIQMSLESDKKEADLTFKKNMLTLFILHGTAGDTAFLQNLKNGFMKYWNVGDACTPIMDLSKNNTTELDLTAQACLHLIRSEAHFATKNTRLEQLQKLQTPASILEINQLTSQCKNCVVFGYSGGGLVGGPFAAILAESGKNVKNITTLASPWQGTYLANLTGSKSETRLEEFQKKLRKSVEKYPMLQLFQGFIAPYTKCKPLALPGKISSFFKDIEPFVKGGEGIKALTPHSKGTKSATKCLQNKKLEKTKKYFIGVKHESYLAAQVQRLSTFNLGSLLNKGGLVTNVDNALTWFVTNQEEGLHDGVIPLNSTAPSEDSLKSIKNSKVIKITDMDITHIDVSNSEIEGNHVLQTILKAWEKDK